MLLTSAKIQKQPYLDNRLRYSSEILNAVCVPVTNIIFLKKYTPFALKLRGEAAIKCLRLDEET